MCNQVESIINCDTFGERPSSVRHELFSSTDSDTGIYAVNDKSNR